MKARIFVKSGFRFFCILYAIYKILYISIVPAQQPAASDASTSATTSSLQATASQADGGVTIFVEKCASCHTIGGGAIVNAPDLLASTTWTQGDLETAIKRMEKNVGPLSATEVTKLAEFLKNPQVKTRLKEAMDAVAAQRKAALAPPSAATGRALFFGQQALAQRGMNCSACHMAGGAGGALGVDLTHVYQRMGETALQSAIQGANFITMKPAYATKPISAQEAAHLTAFLRKTHEDAGSQTLSTAPTWQTRSFAWGGLALAGLGLLGITLGLKRGDRGGVRANLVKQATRSRER